MYEYIYDNFDNQISSIRYIFDESLESFVNYSKTENTFNNNYTMDETVFSNIDAADLSIYRTQPIQIDNYLWDNDISNWSMPNYLELYYSGIENSLSNKSYSEISVYPNPTSDFVIIKNQSGHKLSNIEIFDSWGNIVIEKSFVEQTVIPVKNLSSGVYYIYINGNFSSTGIKLIKK
jgi:hypothetical protein